MRIFTKRGRVSCRHCSNAANRALFLMRASLENSIAGVGMQERLLLHESIVGVPSQRR